MKLDDPKAVEVLKALVEEATQAKAKRDERMAELLPLHEEYLRLELESGAENVGKSGIGGLRVQLSFALLYREIGTAHLHPSQVGAICVPGGDEDYLAKFQLKMGEAMAAAAPKLMIDEHGKGHWR